MQTELKPVAAKKNDQEPDPNARPVTLVLAGMWSLASCKPVEPEEHGKGKGKKKPAKKRPPSAKKGKKQAAPAEEKKKEEPQVETEDNGNVRLVRTDSQTMLTVFLLNATTEIKLVTPPATEE